jgi:hypothetical protein
MAYKNCYYPYLEKKVYGSQIFKRKTTQTDQAPPTKQKQIKQIQNKTKKKLSIKIFSSLMCIYQKFWKNVTVLILIQIHTERAINHLITKSTKYY